ncbi:BolA-like protein [Armadillidium vulgare]|nr:BolA-like protein [Armadillidium vulgare]
MAFCLKRIINLVEKPYFYRSYNEKFIYKFHTSFQMNDTDKGPVSLSIETKLKDSLNPLHLQVINESYQHNVPPGSETHFKVIVISSNFNEIPLIKRHRIINEVLSEELNSGVHALSIVAKTPQQWNSSNKIIEKSPPCRGGFGK